MTEGGVLWGERVDLGREDAIRFLRGSSEGNLEMVCVRDKGDALEGVSGSAVE